MLSKDSRLTKSTFKLVMEGGMSTHLPVATLKVINSDKPSQFSVTVSKKVSKSAVERNKVRRRIYSIVRDVFPKIKRNVRGVIVAKPASLNTPFDSLKVEINNLFVKSGLLK